MHLTLSLLENFKSKPDGAAIIMPSILEVVPFSIINPVYSRAKAWLHFWTMAIWAWLSKGGYERIELIEIAPSSMATDWQ